MGRLFMRHRVSWLFLVVVAALVLSWLASPITSRATDDGSTDLAATPCKITAQPTTVGDPTIRFVATVTYGREASARMPSRTAVTRADFIALPSNQLVASIPLTGSFRFDLGVPAHTTDIAVRLTTGKNVDPTIPATGDNLGRFPIDMKSPTTITWRILKGRGAYPEPSPTRRY